MRPIIAALSILVAACSSADAAHEAVPVPALGAAPGADDTPSPPHDDSIPALAPDTASRDRMAAYTLDVMRSWTHAVDAMPVVDYEGVASDIAAAVLMDGAHVSARDAVMLAGLAYWEGARYAAYVDDGRCNDRAWRQTAEAVRLMRLGGNCDNGHAHSFWQIHPVMDSSSSIYEACNAEAVDGSRAGAARCALLLARSSMAARGDLSMYTGEFSFEHPKADLRLDFVNRASDRHPYSP